MTTAEQPALAARIAQLERQVAAMAKIIEALETELRASKPAGGFWSR